MEKRSKDIVYIYTTCSSVEEAKYLGFSAIREKLAINLDYWIVNSIYPWNNILKNISQCMLMFSTQRILSEKLIKHIEEKHSYYIPLITMCDSLITNQRYNLWAENNLSSKQGYLTESEVEDIKKKEDFYYQRLK